MFDAYEGFALAKGINKPQLSVPTKKEREELHRKINEREMKKRNGNA